MNRIAQTVVESTKKFARTHKTAITVVATAVPLIAINKLALKQHDDFLKDNGLYEKFYTPEEDQVSE